MDNIWLDPILRWLAEREPHFPETPWLKIKADAIAKIDRQRTERKKQEDAINATRPAGEKIRLAGRAGEPGESVPFIEWLVEAIGPTVLNLRLSSANFGGVWMGDEQKFRAWLNRKSTVIPPEWSIKLEPKVTVISGSVNWLATNEEILKQFKWFLERERPKQFKGNANTRLGHRGFDIEFPFSKGTALNWLGVLRRRENVKNWDEFFDFYPESRRNFSKAKRADWYSEQARSKDVRLAKHILDWFDKGIPLNKKGFR